MASARELLQQADALMRRNRAGAIDTEIPELTEMVAVMAPALVTAPIALGDVPELTDAVEEIEIASIVELPDDASESSGWLHYEHGDWSVMGRGPDSVGNDVPMAEAPVPSEPVADAAVPLPASQPQVADDWARWGAIAEEIRMQVLQRIDIFTDTRLREQLSAQLQPIVDRASVEMVTTINEEVGKLLRAYIAEAIEREIEKWRGTTD